ncbi:hypothetical protein HMPREF1548_06472 [Clostridium sp. KLE 1755]|nr:hypothetical protein HMPREF1548_06472 [Clostridium sp. KLE 1755]
MWKFSILQLWDGKLPYKAWSEDRSTHARAIPVIQKLPFLIKKSYFFRCPDPLS